MAGIPVVSAVKYLGVKIEQGSRYFRGYKREKIELAEKMEKMTLPVVAKACNRLLIGKTYWKSVVLPGVLYALPVIKWNSGELGRLKYIENKSMEVYTGST